MSKPYCQLAGYYSRQTSLRADCSLILLGWLLLFASSQLMIPLRPVPITLQTIAVSLIGLTYRPRLAFITVLFYILAGLLGLPSFSKFASGWLHIAGPTGGYIAGFLIAAPLIGVIQGSKRAAAKHVIFSCLIGHAVIYGLGVSWLAAFIGLKGALVNGLLVYLPAGYVKITIFSYLFAYVKQHLADREHNL